MWTGSTWEQATRFNSERHCGWGWSWVSLPTVSIWSSWNFNLHLTCCFKLEKKLLMAGRSNQILLNSHYKGFDNNITFQRNMPMSHCSTGTYHQINGREKKTGGAYPLTNLTCSSVATVWNGLTWACCGQKYTRKFRLGQNYNYCLVLMLCGLSIKLQKRLGPDVHILRS